MSLVCHICFSSKTDCFITYVGDKSNLKNYIGASLPTCVYCVPAWINNEKHHWWYEIKINKNYMDQRKPTDEEVSNLLKLRKKGKDEQNYVDIQLKEKLKDKDYIGKFHVKELLSCWDEENQKYKF